MPRPEFWNSLAPYILNLGQTAANEIRNTDIRSKLQNLYSAGIDKLFSFMNPSATYTDEQGSQLSRSQVSEQVSEGNDPTQSIVPDTKGALKSLYETTGNLMQYGDEGKQYAGLLSNLYQGMQPKKPETKTVGNTLLEHINNKWTPVYEGNDLKPYTGIKTRVEEKEGKYQFKLPFINSNGDVTYKNSPATEQDYQIQQAEDVSKSLDWLEKKDITQQDKIEFKLMFPSLGKGLGDIGTSIKDAVLTNAVQSATEISSIPVDQRTDTQQQTLDRVLATLKQQYPNQDPTAMLNDVSNADFKSKYKNKSVQQYLVDRGKNIQSQYDEIMGEFQKVIAQINSGGLTPEQAKQVALQYYNAIKDSLYGDTFNLLREQLKQQFGF